MSRYFRDRVCTGGGSSNRTIAVWAMGVTKTFKTVTLDPMSALRNR